MPDGTQMTSGAVSRRLLLWTAFVIFCTLGMGYMPFAYQTLPVVGHVSYYQVLLLISGLLGATTLMRVASRPEPSKRRTMCRVLIAYLVFELLVVTPVALWLGAATLTAILSTMTVRFTWLLFPVMLAVCADDRGRRAAGVIAVAAASCLAMWSVYSAATGGGGYYSEAGEMRWRVLVLGGGGLLLFAWPLVVAASEAVPRRYAAFLLGVSLVGLALTNSRSGLIAFAIAGLACVAMSGQTRRLLSWIVPVGVIGTAAWLFWGQHVSDPFGYTFSHLFDISSGNGADRLMRWRLAWDFFVSRPFNDYVWSWRYYLVYVRDPYQPHNFVLEIAIFEGLAGLVFYGSMLTTALKGAWALGRTDAEARALIGYLIAYLVFSFQNADWYLPVNIALLVAALAALVARVDQLRAAGESCSPGAEVLE